MPPDTAELLVSRMAAEKISNNLYRMFSPDSIFLPAKDFPQTHLEDGKAVNTGPGEIAGLRFKHPDPARLRRVRRAEILTLLAEYSWASA